MQESKGLHRKRLLQKKHPKYAPGQEKEGQQMKTELELFAKQTLEQGGSASSQKTSSRRLQAAMEKSNSVVGIYRVTASSLNLRIEAGTQGGEDTILTSIKKGETVHCYGYYNVVKKVKWLLVQYMNFQGYVSTEYLEKA